MTTSDPGPGVLAMHRGALGIAAQLTDSLWRLRLKNPLGHLLVNSYIYKTAHITAVIDPGWPWTLPLLESALRELQLAPSLRAVDRWLYTHSHIDHMGMASLLEQHSDAPQLAWSAMQPHFADWHGFQDRLNDWSGWVAQAFASPEREALLEAMARQSTSGGSRTMRGAFGEGALTRVTPFELGDVLELDDLKLQVLDARGHDPYHVAFFASERGWLFSGDAVLAVPTPITPSMGDDVGLYLETLDRLEPLPASLLMPGHGSQVIGREEVTRAVQRSRQMMLRYEAQALTALQGASGPVDLHTLGKLTSPDGEVMQPKTRWWVHLATLDAHLERLVARGEVVCARDARGPLYVV